MGAECLSSATMPVHGPPHLLVLLRRNQSSAVLSQISDGRVGDLLHILSFMGRKRIHFARFIPCLARCTLGRMVVAKRIPSLPLCFLYGYLGDSAVLLAHARFIALFADRCRRQ